MELEDLTNDELNDLCALKFPKLKVKTNMRKKTIIKKIQEKLTELNMSVDNFINIQTIEETQESTKKENIPELIEKEIDIEPIEEKTKNLSNDTNLLLKENKPNKFICDRCGGKLKIIDEVNNDCVCQNCGAKITIMY